MLQLIRFLLRRLGCFRSERQLPARTFTEEANTAFQDTHNNAAERALRIFALGRKNFLFAGHVEGARNLAILQSLVSTCRLHGVNPYEYLRDLLIRVQTHPSARIDELLPWNWLPNIDLGPPDPS